MVKGHHAFFVLCPFKPEYITSFPFGVVQQKFGNPVLGKQKIFLPELEFCQFAMNRSYKIANI